MRVAVWVLVAAVFTGCAGPGGGAGTLPQGQLPSPSPSVAPSPVPQPRGTGTVTVQFTNTTQQRFTFVGYDALGRTIYGPLTLERREPIVLPDVPLNARTLGIAVEGGAGQAALTLTATPSQTIRDPEVLPFSALVGLEVQPASTRVAKETGLQLTATGRFNTGQTVLMSAAVQWLSLDPFVVPVNSTGEIGGVGDGAVTVVASAGVVNGTSRVTATSARLDSLNIVPARVTLASLANTTVAVRGNFSDGTTQDMTTLVTWTSSRPEVATVSASGLVVALSGGETVLTAAGGNLNTTCIVTVAP